MSAGCSHCYAEKLAGRNPGTLGVWGPSGTRVVASESMWANPIKWNKEAEGLAERPRVFCASLADVFEGAETMPQSSQQDVLKARVRLIGLIAQTPNLDWLLLTKRPQNVLGQLQDCMMRPESTPESDNMLGAWLRGEPPVNVWLGTSVEDQKQADARSPELLKIPAKVRFLSCEPLLGEVDLTRYADWLGRSEGGVFCPDCPEKGVGVDPDEHELCLGEIEEAPAYEGINWVIAGGESGPNARPMHPSWAYSLRDQCNAANVPFLFKQWGEWLPSEDLPDEVGGRGIKFFDNGQMMTLVGKKNAGRLLDGREHNDFPEVPR